MNIELKLLYATQLAFAVHTYMVTHRNGQGAFLLFHALSRSANTKHLQPDRPSANPCWHSIRFSPQMRSEDYDLGILGPHAPEHSIHYLSKKETEGSYCALFARRNVSDTNATARLIMHSKSATETLRIGVQKVPNCNSSMKHVCRQHCVCVWQLRFLHRFIVHVT